MALAFTRSTAGAAAITVEPVLAGARVIAEGDVADDVWFIREGTFTASTVGPDGERRTLSRMGPDTWFGEIGVIGRRPRTADVDASTDGTVWRLPGVDLLAAIEGGARISDPAARFMELRVRRSGAARSDVPVA